MVKDGGEERPENKLEFSGRIRFRDLEETQTDPGTPAKKKRGNGARISGAGTVSSGWLRPSASALTGEDSLAMADGVASR